VDFDVVGCKGKTPLRIGDAGSCGDGNASIGNLLIRGDQSLRGIKVGKEKIDGEGGDLVSERDTSCGKHGGRLSKPWARTLQGKRDSGVAGSERRQRWRFSFGKKEH